VSLGVQSLAMRLTSLLPDILILAITVFPIWKFESSVPFLVEKMALSTPNALMNVFPMFNLSVFACQKQTLPYSILVLYILLYLL
jgi:hypothetical protein